MVSLIYTSFAIRALDGVAHYEGQIVLTTAVRTASNDTRIGPQGGGTRFKINLRTEYHFSRLTQSHVCFSHISVNSSLATRSRKMARAAVTSA